MKCNAYLENRCKSCQYLDNSYAESLKNKEREFFRLFNDLDSSVYQGFFSVSNPKASRNKAKLSVSLDQNQKIVFGIYNAQREFSQLEDCPLHFEEINSLLIPLRDLLEKYKMFPYDLKTQKGELKNILITFSDTTKEGMLRFVLRSKESIDRLKKLSQELQLIRPDVKVISVNIQPDHKAILEGEVEIILTEKTFIEHRFEEFTLHLVFKSFFQVTSEVARNLYSTVCEYFDEISKAQNKKFQQVLDLYCGVGAFSFYLSKSFEKVTGVEISKEAILFAEISKQKNHSMNIDFKALDVDDYLKSINLGPDVVLVNPPRRGLGSDNAKKILDLSSEYIVYSSCNPLSLKSDFDYLKDHYRIVFAKNFDMFPYSKHFESLLILIKK